MHRTLLMRGVWPVVAGLMVDACGGSSEPSDPPVAKTLSFLSQPGQDNAAGKPYSPAITVEIKDQHGNRLATATNAVTLATGANELGGTVIGKATVNAVAGLATFDDITLDRPGAYTLRASAAGLATDESQSFGVRQEFAQISAGGGNPAEGHTCSVNTAGYAHCWGSNRFGQLGDGTTAERQLPALVAGGITFRLISAGGDHTCGVATDGKAYCWGSNAFGQLGDGTTTQRNRPQLVLGGWFFATISAGHQHTCGVVTTGVTSDQGGIFCWGSNDQGQLGDGTTASRATPTPVGGLTYTRVSASDGAHTCAITHDALAYCWGQNQSGQLGDGTTTARLSPTLVRDAASHRFSQITAGKEHSCAMDSNGSGYCWGSNATGQIGDGDASTNPRLVPSRAGNVERMSAGMAHTCGRGISSTTLAFTGVCWGQNSSGQLGDGTTTDRIRPTEHPEIIEFTQLDVGPVHSCGINHQFRAWCWGNNSDGQLGDGTNVQRLRPTRIYPTQ